MTLSSMITTLRWLLTPQKEKPEVFCWPMHSQQNLLSPRCISVCNSWDTRHSHPRDLRLADPSVRNTMLQTPVWLLCPSSGLTQMSCTLVLNASSQSFSSVCLSPLRCIRNLTWEMFFLIISFFSLEREIKVSSLSRGNGFWRQS